ncbi:MAG TPA: SDR family NAD(P)-dependent oxidoreductase [Acidimicrobiia bacterium]|jgi:NAD(P)-dependent dehydrogenase (short-subunit alcohol dehydrogenase family)|nr:SDR family NAD(P)-dependent oxidoreductase [Acidimicrobiia bacterium]
MGLLEGKTAIVTGGGGGIGRGIAERYAAEGAAVTVAELDASRAHETVTAIRAAGGVASGVVADVRDEAEVDRVLAATLDDRGGVDILVNNVGHYGGARKPFHESTRDEWLDLYRVNLEHVLLLTRAVLPNMVERGSGAIVNVSTIEAFRGIPTRAVYAAFKAGVTALTKSLALEYAQHGIRVNAIAPDVTETLQVPYSRWLQPGDESRIPQWVPIGRFGTPADLAGVALFLASDLAGFVTGTTVHADGGTYAAGGWFRTEEGGWTNRPRRP